ncbi:hypothetical protein HN011_010191 [Eciton burchellii]|nr:hypothetical protein HN011_010191 [Eciton burchellii]
MFDLLLEIERESRKVEEFNWDVEGTSERKQIPAAFSEDSTINRGKQIPLEFLSVYRIIPPRGHGSTNSRDERARGKRKKRNWKNRGEGNDSLDTQQKRIRVGEMFKWTARYFRLLILTLCKFHLSHLGFLRGRQSPMRDSISSLITTGYEFQLAREGPIPRTLLHQSTSDRMEVASSFSMEESRGPDRESRPRVRGKSSRLHDYETRRSLTTEPARGCRRISGHASVFPALTRAQCHGDALFRALLPWPLSPLSDAAAAR